MGDLIDRQATLKHIEKIRQGVQMMDDTHRASIIMNGMHLCEEAVMYQPPAQPEPNWIPVYKDKPKAGEKVLLCLDNNEIVVGVWSDKYNEFDWWDDSVGMNHGVIAWMPRPEGYHG